MSVDISRENKRIVKNATMLYVRMFFTMLVALYTSRIILQRLGVLDYGIYNLVFTVVMIFLFLNNMLSEATQRFIIYEIGGGNKEKVNKYFINSVNLHLIISIIILLLCETVGIWLFYNKLDIPLDRRDAAMWAYQISILTSIIGILSVPYNAIIISYERMTAFAYISIIEVLLKLLIAYLISVVRYDHLIVYATLLCFVQIIIRFVYYFYCVKSFEAARYKLSYDKLALKEMISFSSWYVLGYIGLVMNNQGIKVLLNIFFGPIINAAIGVAEQVQNVLTSLRSNFQIAINPQITKSYARHDYENMQSLIFASTKYSFYIFWIFAFPIFFQVSNILKFWLGNVPMYAADFVNLLLIVALMNTLSNPLVVSIGAIGRLKKITLIQSFFSILVMPISYVLLKNGFTFVYPLYVYIIILIINYFISLLFLSRKIKLKFRRFVMKSWIPMIFVVFMSLLLSFVISYFSWEFWTDILSRIFLVCVVIFCLGLDASERKIISAFVKQKIQKT